MKNQAPSTDNKTSLGRKNSHLALAATVLVFMLTAGFTAWLVVFSSNLTISELNWIIVLDCVGFSLVAILANRWSIIEIKKYLEGDKKEQGTCKYCSSKPAGPLLCSHCNSIMWDWISSRYTQTAVFIAQHRWSVLTGFLALFIIAPISLIFGLKAEKVKEIDSVIRRAEAHIVKQNELRSLIREYECCNDSSNINHEKLNAIKRLYTDNSWEFPMLLQEIEELSGDSFIGSTPSSEGAGAFEYAKFVKEVIIDGDTVVARKKIVAESELKERWGDFIGAVYAVRNRTDKVLERKQKAFNLYAEIKVQNLVLREFMQHLQNPRVETDENRKQLLRIFGDGKKTFQPDSLIIEIAKGDYPMGEPEKLMFMMSQ